MSLVALVSRQAAMLRAQRHKWPLRVRIHPLDAAYLTRGHSAAPDARPSRLLRVAGCQVELDCAVSRGRPEVEYDYRRNEVEDDGA